MNDIDNSTKIELLCELAHDRVPKSCIKENKVNHWYGTEYTEDGQDIFKAYYNHYEGILLKYIKEVVNA